MDGNSTERSTLAAVDGGRYDRSMDFSTTEPVPTARLGAYFPVLTASGVDRFLACPGSLLLARVRSESACATAGTKRHSDLLRPGFLPDAALAWFGREPRFEVALAADAAGAAAQYLGQYVERAYAVPGPAWVAGTLDAVDIAEGVLSVGDLKTGFAQAQGDLPLPGESGQLLCGAWLAWRVTAAHRLRRDAEARALATDGWLMSAATDPEIRGWRPRRVRLAWFVDRDGRTAVEDAEVHPDDLAQWGATLARAVQAALGGGTPSLARGPHCGTCDRFDACPAQGDAIRRLAQIPRGDGPLSDEQVAGAFRDLADAERVCEAARAALLARVEAGGPVPVGRTHELTTIRAHVARIDATAAAESGVLGDDLPHCLTVTLTQEGLRRGLRRRDVDDVVERLDQAGAVQRVPAAPYLKLVRRRHRREAE